MTESDPLRTLIHNNMDLDEDEEKDFFTAEFIAHYGWQVPDHCESKR